MSSDENESLFRIKSVYVVGCNYLRASRDEPVGKVLVVYQLPEHKEPVIAVERVIHQRNRALYTKAEACVIRDSNHGIQMFTITPFV